MHIENGKGMMLTPSNLQWIKSCFEPHGSGSGSSLNRSRSTLSWETRIHAFMNLIQEEKYRTSVLLDDMEIFSICLRILEVSNFEVAFIKTPMSITLTFSVMFAFLNYLEMQGYFFLHCGL